MANSKIKKATLPPSGIGKYERAPLPEHVDIIKMLRKEPNEWFEVRTFPSKSAAATFAGNVRHNKFVAFRDDTYEATVRDLTVYARLVRG